MQDHIVVDVEIQKTIDETPGGWDATDKLGVAVAVVYEFKTDRYRIYGSNNVPNLRRRLEAADRISGFNIWRFDYPVIYGLPSRERVEVLRPKTNDILLRIWRSLGLDTEQFSKHHKGYGLDAICMATFGVGKSGNGADAPLWYQAGMWEKLVDYCIDDVRLERNLAAFVGKYGFVRVGNRVIDIDRKNWTP